MHITLSRNQIDEAHLLARQSLDRWQNRRGHYNNRLRSHLIGRIGEMAVSSWLHEMGLALTNHYLDPDAEPLCDITVKLKDNNAVRIEVKTWAARYWPDLGRCIAVNQYCALAKKCDLVVWCVIPNPIPVIETQDYHEVVVDIGRWSTLSDIKSAPQRWTGRASMRQVHNYQLDEKAIRDSDSLAALLKGTL